MPLHRFGFAIIVSLFAGTAHAAEISVLSAGAVEPGLHAAVEAFRKATGEEVKVRFATAPALRQLVGSGERADVLIAPPPVVAEMTGAGKVEQGAPVPVGRVGVGVAVRVGAPVPDVSNAEALKRAVGEAESLVYNQASTGNYVHGLLQRLGIADQLAAKTKRYPDGDAVMAHLIKGSGQEVGFGAITEIMLYTDKGLRFVGPLSADVQNYTSYVAAPLVSAGNAEGGKRFLAFLGSAEAKRIFNAKGIE